MEALKRFRLMTVRLALVLSLVAALVAYGFDPIVARALMGGGIAGVLAFWIGARHVERLATTPPSSVKSYAYRWTALRLAFYAVVLYWAYRLDRDTLRGLLAAAGGLLIIRFVVILVGLTGLDLREESRSNGQNR